MYYSNIIRVPQKNSEIISRQNLIELLNANNSKQFILISAPAGFGKTTLLQQYISGLKEETYIWLQGSDIISSQYTLSKMILTALINLKFKVNESFYHLLDSFERDPPSDEKVIEEVIDKFVNVIANLTLNNFKLIIDDYQILEQNDHKNKINTLIFKLTNISIEGLTVILSSREEFSFPTSKLEAKRNLLKIHTKDLIFSDDEVYNTALQIYNLDLTNDEVTTLQNNVNGWISAIHLILQKGKCWQAELESVKKFDIFRYFSEDIFLELNENIKKFIYVTGFLKSFNEDESNQLLKITNSREIIQIIIKKKVFIESLSDENGNLRYSYQKLFSEFLNDYHYPIDKEIFNNIAEYYKLRNDYKYYIYFLLKAEQTKKAIEFFHNNTIGFISKNNLVLYSECLYILADANLDENGFLFYHQCRLELFKGITINELTEAVKSINSDYIHDIDISILLSEYCLLNNKFEEAQKQLSLINPYDIPVNTKHYINFLLARIYFRMGAVYYEKAIDICLSETDPEVSNPFKGELFGLLGNIYKDKGNLAAAIKYYQFSLQNKNDYLKYIKHTGSLIELHSMLGDYETAYSYLQILNSLIIDVHISSLSNIILRTQFFFYDHIGDYANAVKALNESLENAESKNNPILLMSKYLELANEYWYLGKFSEARDMFILAEKIYHNSSKNEYFEIIFPYFRNSIADNSSDFKATEQSLLNVISWHKKNNIDKPLSYFLFYLSELYLKYDNHLTSIKYLKEAFESLSKYGMYSFLENRFLPSRTLFDFAISQNNEKKFIGTVFNAIKNKLRLDFISEEYREELKRRIFRLTDIYFFPFGNTEFYQRGETVAEDKWIRKKSKILLAYLMCDPEKIHTKDRIMDLFFVDMPVDKADVVYHSSIYNIRTALKIYDVKSEKPKRSKDKTYDYNPQYILYEDKTLRLNPDFYYTSDNIEFEKHYNMTNLPALSSEEKITHSIKAIELYKGDFLPGYYDSWCEELRVKYKNMYIILLEDLIKLLEEEARFEGVVKYSEILLNEDKLNDPAHISIVNAHTKLGNIKMAMSRYEKMLKIYDEELGEKPQPKTLEKITLILSEVAGPP